MSYDSTKDTQEHINRVRYYINPMIENLTQRALNHDASKLENPEKEYFDKYTPELENLEYGTLEYKESCKKLKPALDHHYSVNDHHAQFHGEEGINGMNLLSLLEMLADWKASGERDSLRTEY